MTYPIKTARNKTNNKQVAKAWGDYSMSQKVSWASTKARDAEEIKYGRKLNRLNASEAGTKPSCAIYCFLLIIVFPRKHFETISCPSCSFGTRVINWRTRKAFTLLSKKEEEPRDKTRNRRNDISIRGIICSYRSTLLTSTACRCRLITNGTL